MFTSALMEDQNGKIQGIRPGPTSAERKV